MPSQSELARLLDHDFISIPPQAVALHVSDPLYVTVIGAAATAKGH
jgi:hypothetical protein